MTQVYLGVGSNLQRCENIQRGIELLLAAGEMPVCSPVYECPCSGAPGAAFYNLVISLQTQRSVEAMVALCKEIECLCLRQRPASVPLSLSLDIDLLLYGDLVISQPVRLPRPDIIQHSFILKPLADLAGDVLHPTLARSFAELWAELSVARSPMRVVAWQPMIDLKETHG